MHFCVIIFFLLQFSSCITTHTYSGNADKIFSQKPIILTHRGDTNFYPESTIEAFQEALKNGATMLEMDLQLTKDNIIVVCHDDNLKRLTGLEIKISETNYSELKKLNIAKFFNDKHKTDFTMSIPTLEDIFEKFPNTPVSLEIKPFFGDTLADQLLQIIEKRNNHDLVLVASFYAGNLKYFRKISRGKILTSAGTQEVVNFMWKTYWMPQTIFAWPFQVLQLPKQADPQWLFDPFLAKEFVERSHKQNLKLLIYGINDRETYDLAKTIGLDGIITDEVQLSNSK